MESVKEFININIKTKEQHSAAIQLLETLMDKIDGSDNDTELFHFTKSLIGSVQEYEKILRAKNSVSEAIKLREALFQSASSLAWCMDKFMYVYPSSVEYTRSQFLKAINSLGLSESEFWAEWEVREQSED